MRYLVWITLLLQLGTAWADPGDNVNLFPRVWHFGNSVQVDIWNTSDVDVDCNGSVTIYTRQGRIQNEYYWETIYRGMSRMTTYRLWDYRDQVQNVHNFIYCRER